MSSSKKLVLVGVSVATIISLIGSADLVFEIVQSWTDVKTFSSDTMLGLLIAFIITVVWTSMKIVAYRRIGTEKERAWFVFILLLGIISLVFAIQSIVSFDWVNFLLEGVQATCFILAFLLRNKKIEKKEVERKNDKK